MKERAGSIKMKMQKINNGQLSCIVVNPTEEAAEGDGEITTIRALCKDSYMTDNEKKDYIEVDFAPSGNVLFAAKSGEESGIIVASPESARAFLTKALEVIEGATK